MAPLKVLIAGAGISGPALAFWLSRIGCNVTIVERSPHLRATGQQIDLTGQAIVIMRMMGIEKEVQAALCHEPGRRFIDRQGKSVAFLPANKAGERSLGGSEEFEIMRGDLVRILYDITKDLPQMNYVFGTYVKSFTQDEGPNGGKVHVTFSDDTQDEYDIFVGADGDGSPTRQMMLGSSSPDPLHDMGFHIAYFTAPAAASDLKDWAWCFIPGGKMVMTRKDSPDNIRVYFLMSGDNCKVLDSAKTLAEQKEVLAQIFKEKDSVQLPRFLRDLKESPMSDDLYSQHMWHVRLPEGGWSRGRVVLVGDAAYSTAAGGVGLTAALVGAYVLAGELAKQWKESQQPTEKFDAEKAAKAYERVLRPLIQGDHGIPKWVLQYLFPPRTTVAIWLFHLVVKVVAALRIDKLLANFGSPDESQELQYEDYFEVYRKDGDAK